jgi:hypothetical protein
MSNLAHEVQTIASSMRVITMPFLEKCKFPIPQLMRLLKLLTPPFITQSKGSALLNRIVDFMLHLDSFC